MTLIDFFKKLIFSWHIFVSTAGANASYAKIDDKFVLRMNTKKIRITNEYEKTKQRKTLWTELLSCNTGLL